MQCIRGNARRYPDGFGEAHPLTGLMYCADCGGKMYVHRTYNGKRKAKMEAAKAAIRAENMEKDIFTTVSQLPKQEPRKATVSASAAV